MTVEPSAARSSTVVRARRTGPVAATTRSDLRGLGLGHRRRIGRSRRVRGVVGLDRDQADLAAGMISISTCSLSPTLTTSSTLAIRLPLPSLEMCTRPSRPGSSETKAPKAVVLTTVPRKRSPTLGSCGLAIELMMSIAACTAPPSGPDTKIVPSSSIAMSAPVCW